MRATGVGLAVAVLVVAIFLVRPGPVAKADDRVCDILTGLVSRGAPSGQTVIVEIDEPSLAEFGRWPWPRDILANVVRRILEHGAATVVLDMMLHDEDRGAPSADPGKTNDGGSRTNDDVLAGVLSGNPVVLGNILRFDGVPTDPSTCPVEPLPLAVVGPGGAARRAFFRATGSLCTAPQLSRAAAAVGFLNGAPDSDGRLRRIPLLMESGNRQYPSLALAAVNVYRRTAAMRLTLNADEASRLRLGTEVVRLEGPSYMRLRFRGARGAFPYIPVSAILSGRAPADSLQGRLAIVGGSALGLPHSYATAVDAQLPDLEVQATAIDNLLQGDSFNRPAGFRLWELFLGLIACLGTTLLARVRSRWGVLIVLGAAAAIWAGCTLLLSTTGLILSPFPATVALACSFPAVTLLRYSRERRRAENTELQLAFAEEQSRVLQRESESRYRLLVENINDAIIVDDAEGRLVFANRRFREWFGLEEREIREVVLEDYVAPEWRAMVREQHTRRFKGQSVPDSYEFQGVRPDGTLVWLEALVTNLEEGGRVVGTQAALRDVTERKRIEALYLQAQKMEGVGRLAGGVAHDFNNLLTVINGYSQLLLASLPDGSSEWECLKQIRAAGERAAELTRNLLTFSRKQLVQPKVLDLNAVVEEAVQMFGRLLGEDVDLSTDLSSELGQVRADAGQMHQVLMNLLVNAGDAMPEGGSIAISTRNIEADGEFVRLHPDMEPGSYVCLRVSDTGTGMTDEVRQHIFEPFFTTKEPGRGTGLGLATIYGIVRQSAGRIEVASKPGEGATFDVYLPRMMAGGSAQATAPDSAALWHGTETVLVVEDQAAVLQYVCSVLHDAGYRLLEAANGPDALVAAQQFEGPIHLLLSDIVLPGMNGLVLSEQLKASRPGIRILFMSGYAEEAMGNRGIVANQVTYLPKPFGPDALRAKVREALIVPMGVQPGRTAGG